MKPPLNLRETVRRFHVQAIEAAPKRPQTSSGRLLHSQKLLDDLRQAYEQMYRLRNSVGRMPPRPNTRRARLGALLVTIVQRMLFWYTPQILKFNSAATTVAENACLMFERQLEALEELIGEVHDLRLELRVHSTPAGAERNPPEAAAASPALDVFEFELRSERREADDRLWLTLRSHLQAILDLDPPPPAGVWLDLACGRGDWFVLARDAGFEVLGVEANARAVEHCRDAGVPVARRECLEYLSSTPDQQFAVISAFQVLERYPFEHVFQLIRQAARILKPGGLLIIEAADPANILNSADRFWRETANLRFVPVSITEALLNHFGFRIVSKRWLNASPPEEQFPWHELELVKRLNHHFHGPRDYAIIGRISGLPSIA